MSGFFGGMNVLKGEDGGLGRSSGNACVDV